MLCLTAGMVRAQFDVVFSNHTIIASDNTAYDHRAVLVDGATLTVDGQHRFARLSLTNGATLTHSPTTGSATHALRVIVDDLLCISADSAIDVTARGYLAGRTYDNTTAGASTGAAGGSYGGPGAPRFGIACATYGDLRNPNEPGSGSGTHYGGAPGGGLIRLTAAVMELAGTIHADGADHPSTQGGGGSGGGIRVEVGTLRGSGTITANGGARAEKYSFGGGGGGGRIAIYYTAVDGFDLTNNISCVGVGSDKGAPGTIYLKPRNQLGTAIIDGRDSQPRYTTPLTLPPGTNYFENLTLAGTGVVVALNNPAVMPANLALLNGARLTHPFTTGAAVYQLNLAVLDTLYIDPHSAIDVTGHGYLPGRTTGNSDQGAATGSAGGSYGGQGQRGLGTVGILYGDLRDPREPGSGAGTGDGGGSGGGLIRLTVPTLVLDGAIRADGDGDHPNRRDGGGSGGGIRIDAGSVRGRGVISANGGQRGQQDYFAGGGGGGGRIALYAHGTDAFDLASQMTCVGTGANPGNPGSIFTTNATPLPTVEAVQPAGCASTAVYRLSVSFAVPIDPRTFTLDDVTLTGPAGPLPLTGLSQLDMFRYEIRPAAFLAADGDYTLRIGPHLTSLLGGAMDAAFSHVFSIDIPPPDMPALTNVAAWPETNLTTQTELTLRGTRSDDSSIWINGVERVENGCGPWAMDTTLSEGVNRFAVHAENLAGKPSPTNVCLVIRDTVAPAITAIIPSNGAARARAPDTVQLMYIEETSGIVVPDSTKSVTRNDIPISGEWHAAASRLVFTPSYGLLEGHYVVSVTLIDRCGHRSPPFKSSFRITAAPSIPHAISTVRGTLFLFDKPMPHVPTPLLDSDHDGLPDAWELETIGDLSSGPDDDLDGDGMTNAEEFAAGCDPLAADTDGDGIRDGDDPHPTENHDTDADGLPDDWELFWFGHLDEDGDGVADGDSYNNRDEYLRGGDPTRADTPDTGNALPLVVHLPLE